MRYTAYFGIKFYSDNRNRDEIVSLTAALENSSINAYCMARDYEQWGEHRPSLKTLMDVTFDEIRKSDLVVLEMTEKGVGLGIEAGYAVAVGKPVVILIKNDRGVSGTMQGIAAAIIRYNHPDDLNIWDHLEPWK